MNNNIMPIVGVTTLCILIIAAVFEVISARRHDRKQGLHPVERAPQHVGIDITVVHVPAPMQDDRESCRPYDEYADAEFVLLSFAEMLALQLREPRA